MTIPQDPFRSQWQPIEVDVVGYRIVDTIEGAALEAIYLFCNQHPKEVAEPPELFRLKCASHRYTADNNLTHFKRNNPLVCRVSARYNHSSTGSKQVYLA
jgi:hypothetical protein